MKHFYLAMLLLCLSVSCLAQSTSEVQKVHTLKFPVPGYSFEQPVGPKTVLNFEVFLSGAFAFSSAYGSSWFLSPALRFEPRFYYNYFKRQEKGKSVANNSSSFACIKLDYHSDIYIGNDAPYSYVSCIPCWGFKVPMGEKFIFEASAGAGIMLPQFSEFDYAFSLDLSFGFCL